MMLLVNSSTLSFKTTFLSSYPVLLATTIVNVTFPALPLEGDTVHQLSPFCVSARETDQSLLVEKEIVARSPSDETLIP